ncbi:MAG: methionine--tRNA ligase [Bacteroidetes bacterium]|nr:methionine--tRNA ligase [Bacteroidota bacterium]MDA0979932.1 methionine--tRNA ligase [Bacteroidota bacterium]
MNKTQSTTQLIRTPKRRLITSALPYANGPIHVGHMAGAYLPADIYVRYLRSAGEDVLWVCGSDEHGAAITLRAKKDGTTPREIVDKYHVEMQGAFKGLDISFDHYSRTSSEKHHKVAQDFFLQLLKNDSFEVKTQEQYYDEEADQFLADRYITGTCPTCNADGAYGDQCEKCGSTLSPTELINPKSTLSGAKPVLKPTTLWYLPMGRHEEWLKDYIENGMLNGKAHHDAKAWKSHVVGQCKSWIDGGLQSRAMTRDLKWGVPVPIEGADGKVLYVWLDAPVGYITATMEWAEKNGQDWRDWWQNEDTELLHFIGKDNIVFHCIIFPILLKQHGDFILPHHVPANEFMNLEGDKISTSRNWAVWVSEFLENNPSGSDPMRYVLTSIMPEQRDSEFTWNDYRDRINNELADVLGNFVNRVLVLTRKYYEGVVPVAPKESVLTDVDKSLIEVLTGAGERIGDLILRHRYREAQLEAMNVARRGNKYLTEEEPWKFQKTDPDRVRTIMHLACQVVGNLGIVLEPFLPRTAEKISISFGVNGSTWKDVSSSLVNNGTLLGDLPILFTKIDKETVEAEKAKLGNKGGGSTDSEKYNIMIQKDSTTFDNFSEMDLRVATVTECVAVKKTKKLLELTVDTGLDVRTVVSGIAEHFSPEDVIGRRVVLLANLEPRTIKGVESCGMVLMASTNDGGLRFITPEEGVTPGDVIR